ncbi:agamous-like MADS-box protein AGL61 [Nymphaea colorata]|uniref:agamous-like MADS-box protein AGL61 n=1 Tax=Nymphaea colorata TaxID=210225 RepID=UPI00129DAF60|nr:agamous-like MADS-box protein AGL61 [Nymphaea colorata]
MERIEDKQKRHVTFSKRRNDLFKKAEEICSLTRAAIAIIYFGEAGNPFTFCHPTSTDSHQQFLRQYYGSSSGCTITAAPSQSAPVPPLPSSASVKHETPSLSAILLQQIATNNSCSSTMGVPVAALSLLLLPNQHPWVKPNRLEKLCPSQVGRMKSARNEVAT